MTSGQPGTGNARPTSTGAQSRQATTAAAGTPTQPARTSDKTLAETTPDQPAPGDGGTTGAASNGGPEAGPATNGPAKDAARRGDKQSTAAKQGTTAKQAATAKQDGADGGTAASDRTAKGTDASKDDGPAKNDGQAKNSSPAKDGEPAKDGGEPAKDSESTKDGEPAKGAKAGDADGTDKADGEAKPVGPERWEAFASAPEPRPSIFTRVGRAVGRFLIHEWTLAALGALALAVLMTWPTLRYPRYTLPQDYWDPSLQAWQMAWSGHILLADPARLWQSNTFFPELWSFAFSDTLLGYAPAGMLGSGPRTPCCATTSCSCWRTRSPRSGRTRWPDSSGPAGSVRPSPG